MAQKELRENPTGWMSGYVGPAAYSRYQRGGFLLPTYQPPLNPEWRNRINERHHNN
jgi:hypothetical protein